jgi:AcrR family transcriptional regulator
MTLSELSRRERKKGETRRRIFESAVDLFRAKGFEDTTVDEITERADVGRGTFFNYFPRKEAVLAYLSESHLEVAEENASELLRGSTPVRAKLIELYLHAASAYEQDRELSRFVFAEWMKRGFAPTQEAGKRWKELVLAVLDQGHANGELRSDVSDVRAGAMLTGVYISTIYEWLYCPDDCHGASVPDLRSELTARLEILIDGLLARREVRS